MEQGDEYEFSMNHGDFSNVAYRLRTWWRSLKYKKTDGTILIFGKKKLHSSRHFIFG